MKMSLWHNYKGIKMIVLFVLPHVSFFYPAQAQHLSLTDCINQALESNYALKMTRNTAEMARNNAGYSSFLPTLDANARQNQSRNDIKSENSLGETNKASDVKTDTYSAGLALNWRLFDGLDMFATHERYKELEAKGELVLRQDIESLIVEVCSLYYNVIVHYYRLEAAEHNLKLSNERYEDAQFRYEIGKNSKLDARQAIVDLHADSSSYVRQLEQLNGAYISLNKILNLDLGGRDYVQDTILMGELLDANEVEKTTLESNTVLLMAKKDQLISTLDLKKARAIVFPTLDFSGGYNYNKTETPSSSTVMNRSNGLYWGFSVNVPIFNKTQNRTRIKNARLDVENAELSYLDTEKEILGDLALLYNGYENNLLMVGFEQESASIAELNLYEALVKFKEGALSGIEFREFQRSYTNAIDRKLSAIYQAKLSELSLQLISGNIRQLFGE